MKFSINIRPLSVNRAWQGRRYSTPEKKQYERILTLLLPKVTVPGPYYRVTYDFYLVNFGLTDWDNLVKPFQDCLVKRGIISDDRKIISAAVHKFKADKDRIEVEIGSVSL